MFDAAKIAERPARAVVVGAGVGGLAAALRLQAAGLAVTVFDAHDWPGGKMRQVPSGAGPVDAGPTVLTMRHVFDELFEATGTRLSDHVDLLAEPILARHFWPDGSTLDLTSDHACNSAAIEAFAGPGAGLEYQRFSKDAEALFNAFQKPMMESRQPRLVNLAKAALRIPAQLPLLSPVATLKKSLRRRFSDPRIVQLFGRYATYVGGSPLFAPALLTLIWQAEALGVWRVKGGMHELAQSMASRLQDLGGTIRLATPVSRIETDTSGVTGVRLTDGSLFNADIVVFGGDPRALRTGLLGSNVISVASETDASERSLSARVWSFAAEIQTDLPLAHHNVFFAENALNEFDDLAGGAMPSEPTIYLCAEDRGTGMTVNQGPERVELILNAAPLTLAKPRPDEEAQCRQTTLQTLERFGLTFHPPPPPEALATPTTFDRLFPGSAGALYGQSPHGMTAALKRPRAKTAIKGLYLAGGGTHPGAGVPMAALSGKHAAEAILADRVSILK